MKEVSVDRSKCDSANQDRSKYKSEPGVNEALVREISMQKNEPEWMLAKRLQGLKLFLEKKMPTWGPSLKKLDLKKIVYYVRPDAVEAKKWEDVPQDIKKTFERLGIPRAESKYLGGVGAQHDSDIIYHNLKKVWEDKGVIFD